MKTLYFVVFDHHRSEKRTCHNFIAIRLKNENEFMRTVLGDINLFSYFDCMRDIGSKEYIERRMQYFQEVYNSDPRRLFCPILKLPSFERFRRKIYYSFESNKIKIHEDNKEINKICNGILPSDRLKVYTRGEDNFVIYNVDYSFEELILAISSGQIKLKQSLFERNLLLIIKRFLLN